LRASGSGESVPCPERGSPFWESIAPAGLLGLLSSRALSIPAVSQTGNLEHAQTRRIVGQVKKSTFAQHTTKDYKLLDSERNLNMKGLPQSKSRRDEHVLSTHKTASSPACGDHLYYCIVTPSGWSGSRSICHKFWIGGE